MENPSRNAAVGPDKSGSWKLLENFFELMQVLIVIVNADGGAILMNKHWQILVGAELIDIKKSGMIDSGCFLIG
jgi:hypothetical protein